MKPEPPSAEVLKQIDSICNRFVDVCIEGGHPRVEEFLSQANDQARPHVLRELLLLEMEYRRAGGEQLYLEDLVTRFPLDASLVEEVFSQTSEAAGMLTLSGRSRFATLTGRASSEPEPMPAKIGRYVVRGALGYGEFGTVYLAEDEQLERRVAVKVPRAERFKSSDYLKSFLSEARKAAGLRHPGVVTIYDVGQLEDGVFCIVMEYIEGRSLRDLLHQDRLSHRQAAELIARVADAVHHAHKNGLVHRDLKPANILLDNEGRPHVADFGLALAECEQHDRFGEVSGTPAYMAPEQLRGEAHYLDGRTDVWALGVILYTALTGRSPFLGQALEELSEEIQRRHPKPPRMIDDHIPRELERICLKCLAKKVEDRYLTAADMAQDLRAAMGLPTPEESSSSHVDLPAAATSESTTAGAVKVPLLVRLAPWAIGGLLTVLVLSVVAMVFRDDSTEVDPAPVDPLIGPNQVQADTTGETSLDQSLAVMAAEIRQRLAALQQNQVRMGPIDGPGNSRLIADRLRAALESPSDAADSAPPVSVNVAARWNLAGDFHHEETEDGRRAVIELRLKSPDGKTAREFVGQVTYAADVERICTLPRGAIAPEGGESLASAIASLTADIRAALQEREARQVALGAVDGPGNGPLLTALLKDQLETGGTDDSRDPGMALQVAPQAAWRISGDFFIEQQDGRFVLAIQVKLKDRRGAVAGRFEQRVTDQSDIIRIAAPTGNYDRWTTAAACQELAQALAYHLHLAGQQQVAVGTLNSPGNPSALIESLTTAIESTPPQGDPPTPLKVTPQAPWQITGQVQPETPGEQRLAVLIIRLKNEQGQVAQMYLQFIAEQGDVEKILD